LAQEIVGSRSGGRYIAKPTIRLKARLDAAQPFYGKELRVSKQNIDVRFVQLLLGHERSVVPE
jgi:hypothetical protein